MPILKFLDVCEKLDLSWKILVRYQNTLLVSVSQIKYVDISI